MSGPIGTRPEHYVATFAACAMMVFLVLAYRIHHITLAVLSSISLVSCFKLAVHAEREHMEILRDYWRYHTEDEE